MSFIVSDIDQTVDNLLSNYSTVSATVFLNTKLPKDIVSNWDRIQRRYSAQELQDNAAKFPSGSILIKQGTPLALPSTYINRDPLRQIIRDSFTFTDLKPFLAQQLVDLLNDPRYVSKIQDFDSGRITGSIEYNDVTIFIWCRSINRWIDVSKYINQIDTSVSASGGSFSFSANDVMCEYTDIIGWTPIDDLQSVSNNTVVQFDKQGQSVRPKFYLNTILSENDLVYIKLEKLQDENHSEISIMPGTGNKIWDMIGLIDTVSNSVNPYLSVTTVQGRDLMKLLIEDGSIFFTSQFLGNIFADSTTLLAKRNLFSLLEQQLIYAFPTFKPVSVLLKYIFNKFSNLGIIPNDAFVSYGSRQILDKYKLQTSSLKAKSLTDVIDQLNNELDSKRQGLWRITDFVFDDEPSQRLVTDPSFCQDNGSMINSIRKIVQEPLLEFYGDTYKDTYKFIVRKPPFDEKGYKGLVYGDVTTEESSAASASGKTGKDSKLRKRIKDKIIRQRNLDILNRHGSLSNFCIDIDDSEVISQQFIYHNEAYSWYRTIPIGLGALDEKSQFLLSPIVSFDAYAEIFGSRTYTIEYNYTPSALLEDSQSNKQYKYAETQAFLDLQHLVQASAYLPFARRGTITITGKRTIKRGLFIYFKPTKEVFYVDQVSHSKSIGNSASENNRTTTLVVSRGLREPYIKGKMVAFSDGPKVVSYFNIINTTIANDASINSQDVLKNWKVNKSIFDFFVQRRQWVD